MLRQVIYSSKSIQPMDTALLEEILIDARRGNEKRDITGALVYLDGVFLQVLEGDPDTVASLVESIDNDQRHDSMRIFYEADVSERAFDSWRMAFLCPDPSETARWAELKGSVSIETLVSHIREHERQVPEILLRIADAIS